MKTINFWSPIDGDEIENPNILMIRILVLYVGKEFWSAGAGEAAVYYKDTESNTNSELLIRYNDEVGFSLYFGAWKESLHAFNRNNLIEKCTVYVCGEPYYMPQNLFVDASDAYEIIKYFCETGKKHTNYTWIDSSHFDFTEE